MTLEEPASGHWTLEGKLTSAVKARRAGQPFHLVLARRLHVRHGQDQSSASSLGGWSISRLRANVAVATRPS
jgi:hypothetical protein